MTLNSYVGLIETDSLVWGALMTFAASIRQDLARLIISLEHTRVEIIIFFRHIYNCSKSGL